MPKYSVRFYSEYCDEYEVEAASAEEAQALAEEYEYVVDMPKPGELERFAGKVERVTKHNFVGTSDTEVNELAADGSYLED